MSTILVSDVFGITPALLTLKEQLGADTIIDPYEGQSMAFDNEAQAYAYFVKTVGLDCYVEILLKAMQSFDSQVTLIGFSVGAAAIWRSSVKNKGVSIKQAFCFYGSQIRNFTEIAPYFKIHLVFPKSELHFDVLKLMQQLTSKANVEITQVEYLHGFMNYCSTNFDGVGYQQYTTSLRLAVM